MEEKTFEKEKAPAAGQNSSPAGHNRRRRRRKKSGAQRAASAQSGQNRETLKGEAPAGDKAEISPADRPEETPAGQETAPAAQTPAPAEEPAETPAQQPGKEPTAPEGPQAPELPELPEEEPPRAPENPEPAESADPAEEAEPARTPEVAQGDGEEEKVSSGAEDASEEAEEEADGEAESAEQQQRAAQMTRTVQLSIEKIVEKIEEEESIPEPDPAEFAGSGEEEGDPDSADPSLPARLRRLHRRVGDSMWSLLKWVAFVVAFVAVVAGAGIAWLYKGAPPDSIPKVSAEFNGEELEPTSYSWHVPVVANVFKRTYAKTVSKEPTQIAATIETAQVDLSVRHTDCDTRLTVEDSDGESVFEGTAEEFGNYTFTKNDIYTAELVIFRNEKKISHTAEVSGKQTYLFSFTVSLRPSIRLNTVSATQGSVVAVRVSGGVSDQVAPTASSKLTATAFHRGENDWVCYLPIGVNQEPGDYTITVSYAGYEQELSLTVKARANVYKDYSSKSKLTSPYIAESDTPAKVLAVLKTGDEQPAWTEDGFNLPFTEKAEVELAYGTTEYVGRTRSERVAGTGTGRISNNVIVSTTRNSSLLSPAAGKVVLAEDLGGTAGYTVVIDHGAGVKSIFYCLRSVSVKVGATVKKGQEIAQTDRTTIGEVRVGTVPVEPLSVWRGECDALNHY